MTSDDVPSWESPWDPETLRVNNYPWSLAGDAGLFLFIQNQSSNFTSNVLDTTTKIDELIQKNYRLATGLDNAFNDFQLLSNTQFLENRIEEEAVDQVDQQNAVSAKSKVLSKEELEEKRKTIYKSCLAASIKIFESTHNQHSGLATDENLVLPEKSDLFGTRPTLPLIIGTPEYQSSSTAGITFNVPAKPVRSSAHAPISNGYHEERSEFHSQTITNGDNESLQDEDQDGELFPTCRESSSYTKNESLASYSVDSNETVSNETPEPPKHQSTIILSPPNLDESSESEDEGGLFTVLIKPKPSTKLQVAVDQGPVKSSASAVEKSNDKRIGDGLGFEAPPPVTAKDDSSDDSEGDIFKPATSSRVASKPQVKPVLDVTEIPSTSKLQSEEAIQISAASKASKPNFMSMFDESSDEDEDLIFGKKKNMFAGKDDKKDQTSKASDVSQDDSKNASHLPSLEPVTTQPIAVSLDVNGEEEPQSEEDKADDLYSDGVNNDSNIPGMSNVFGGMVPDTTEKDEDSSDSEDGFPNAQAKAASSNNFAKMFASGGAAVDSDDDDDDNLFGRSLLPKKPTADKAKPEVKKDEQKLNEGISQLPEKTQKVEGSNEGKNVSNTKPAVSKKLSSDSEDDLFKTLSATKKSDISNGTRKPVTKQIKYSEDDDDNLFTSSIPSISTAPTKQTIGGGDDKQTSVRHEIDIETTNAQPAAKNPLFDNFARGEIVEEKTNLNPTKEVARKPLLSSSDEDIFKPNDSKVDKPVVNKEVVSDEKMKTHDNTDADMEFGPGKAGKLAQRGKIAELSKNLNLNASMLRRPGFGAPSHKGPVRSPESVAGSSASASGNMQSTSTGTNVNEIGKNKAKLGPKRRPPSNMRKVTASTEVNPPPEIEVSKQSVLLPPLSESPHSPPLDIFDAPPPPLPSNLLPSFQPSPVAQDNEVDIFADEDSKRVEPVPVLNAKVVPSIPSTSKGDEVDIFADSVQVESEAKPAVSSKGESSKKKKGQGKAKTKKVGAASKRVDDSIFDTPDDIFDD